MMETLRRRHIQRWFCNADLSLCLLFNRGVRRRPVQRFFAAVSRLGDGVFWYAMMLVLPLSHGMHGLVATLHMLLAGTVGLVLYKRLKGRFLRERPFVAHPSIRRGAAPLDRHSFPSGHTLHAVAFSLVVVAYFPQAVWLVGPFAALVAASRMVLGLHYPSDVLMGAGIGASIAWGSFALLTLL